MFRQIVAAIDSDAQRADQVIHAASEVGRAFRAEVLVAHVRDVERDVSLMAAGGKPGALPPSIHFETEEMAQELVRTAVDRLRGEGIDAHGEVAQGTSSRARELLDIAERYGADLIVVGDRDSRVSDLVLGSVSHRIAHLATCPVLLVR